MCVRYSVVVQDEADGKLVLAPPSQCEHVKLVPKGVHALDHTLSLKT